jgi:hypothetical protein
MGVATSLAQFSRSIGATVGVSIMGAILAAGLPPGAASSALDSGSGGAGDAAAREALASAIHPVFVIGIPIMVVTLALVALIPEAPLRRAVRDDVARPEAPAAEERREDALAA